MNPVLRALLSFVCLSKLNLPNIQTPPPSLSISQQVRVFLDPVQGDLPPGSLCPSSYKYVWEKLIQHMYAKNTTADANDNFDPIKGKKFMNEINHFNFLVLTFLFDSSKVWILNMFLTPNGKEWRKSLHRVKPT